MSDPAKDDPAEPASLTPPAPQEGDYASGWWGEDEARQGQAPPGPYGRPPESRPDAPDLQHPGPKNPPPSSK